MNYSYHTGVAEWRTLLSRKTGQTTRFSKRYRALVVWWRRGADAAYHLMQADLSALIGSSLLPNQPLPFALLQPLIIAMEDSSNVQSALTALAPHQGKELGAGAGPLAHAPTKTRRDHAGSTFHSSTPTQLLCFDYVSIATSWPFVPYVLLSEPGPLDIISHLSCISPISHHQL